MLGRRPVVWGEDTDDTKHHRNTRQVTSTGEHLGCWGGPGGGVWLPRGGAGRSTLHSTGTLTPESLTPVTCGHRLSSLPAPLPLGPATLATQQLSRPVAQGYRRNNPQPHSEKPPQSHSPVWTAPSMLVAVWPSMGPLPSSSALPCLHAAPPPGPLGTLSSQESTPSSAVTPAPIPKCSAGPCSGDQGAPGSHVKAWFPSFAPLLFVGATVLSRGIHTSRVTLLPGLAPRPAGLLLLPCHQLHLRCPAGASSLSLSQASW